MKVTLVEGKVVVDEADDGPAESAAVMVPTVLDPGETLIATAGIKPMLAKVDVDQALRWREGFVEFSDSPLADAMAEMNRYSGKHIILHDAANGNHRVSAFFRQSHPNTPAPNA